MSSFQSLRDFICQRLTAAAAEIFTEFEKTIEEDLDRQRGLLEISLKPQINTNTAEVPEQHVCKDEVVLADLDFCYKESQDQNQPELPQFEEEQKELFSSHKEEELVLNQDTETSVLLQNTSRCEEQLEEIPQDLNQRKEALTEKVVNINWNPVVRLQRIDLPHQHVYKEEEVFSDQQLWNQERNSSLDREEPELPQMKEELCSSQEGEQLVLKQETETLMMTPTDQEPDLNETQPNTEQLSAHSPPLAERTNQEQSQNLDSGSTTDIEMNPTNHHRNGTDDKNVDHSHVSHSQLDTESGDKTSTKSGALCHSKIQTRERPFKCKTCGKAFTRNAHLLRHTRIHTDEKPFDCKTCGKTFKCKWHLLKHATVHTDEKPFECTTCGKTFKCKWNLISHTVIHTDKKPFECKTCGKAFKSSRLLRQHTRSHEREKSFVGKTSKKSFTRPSYSLNHKIDHTDERPFKCKICGKAYKSRSNLQAHTPVHTGERPFSCNICQKTFSRKVALSYHMPVHTDEKPFKCKICGKAYKWNSNLIIHTRIHTGEKPYSCKICQKSFTRKVSISYHMPVHSDEKPFKCKPCGKAYKCKWDLRKHQRCKKAFRQKCMQLEQSEQI